MVLGTTMRSLLFVSLLLAATLCLTSSTKPANVSPSATEVRPSHRRYREKVRVQSFTDPSQARYEGPSKTVTRPFALEGKLLGCFGEVRFPVFSSWPSARIVLGNRVVRSDIYWRFISGFCPIRSNPGRSGQTVHYMQIAQCRINTGDCASR